MRGVQTTTRRLALIRHAKAEGAAASDHERRLTTSGRSAAGAAGAWLLDQGFVPDAVLHSSACRTTQTWSEVAVAGGFDGAAIVVSDALYTAEPENALDLIRATDTSAYALAVVGHNPTISYLAQMLDAGDGDPAVAAPMMRGFAPGAVAVFEFAGAWTELAVGGADLVAFHSGQG